MKKNNNLLLTAFMLLFSFGSLMAQTPAKINYQAVARDASGTILDNQDIGIEISILESSTTGAVIFTETHIVTTTDNGLFNLQIGGGTVTTGKLDTIDWSENSHFLQISADFTGGTNYSKLGTTELVSVPYALMAKNVENDSVNDADADATNELQSLTISNDTIRLSDGGEIKLPIEMMEVDGDSTNELQSITISNDTIRLSEGGEIKLPIDEVDDADADVTNELQNISISNDTVRLSDGGEIKLPEDDTSLWVQNSSNIHYPHGKVGVNNNNPFYQMEALADSGAVRGVSFGNSAKSWENVGVKGEANTDNNQSRGVWSVVQGANTGYGLFSEAQTDGWNYGVFSNALSKSTNANPQYGIFARAVQDYSETSPGTGGHYGGLFRAEGAGQFNFGAVGVSNSFNDAAGAVSRGIQGEAADTNAAFGQGIIGFSLATRNRGSSIGSAGIANGSSSNNYGVYGEVNGGSKGNATGVYGTVQNSTRASNIGVDGTVVSTGTDNIGVGGYSYGLAASGNNYGFYGYAEKADTNYASYSEVIGTGVNYAVYGDASAATGVKSFAGYFDGDVTVTGDLNVTGSIAKGSGTFKIDHPSDPENKYLVHSFVESPEMLNVYSGNIITDSEGRAVVNMPEYFEANNIEYRYQLTVIGTFAQAIVSEEISGNRFIIETDKPMIKVSWAVTGVRNDPYAKANRIEVIQEKPAADKGTYLHPELYGEAASKKLYGSKTGIDIETKKEITEKNKAAVQRGPESAASPAQTVKTK